MDLTKPKVGSVPLLTDLESDLQSVERGKLPLVILFSRSDCAYCHEVRARYLAPMVRENKGAIVREVVSDYSHLTVRKQERLSHKDFSEQMNVRFYPTVYFLDGALKQISKPLLGAGKAGLYQGYLESRISEAERNMK